MVRSICDRVDSRVIMLLWNPFHVAKFHSSVWVAMESNHVMVLAEKHKCMVAWQSILVAVWVRPYGKVIRRRISAWNFKGN